MQLSCSFHSAARRHSFCVRTSHCCVGNWENVSDGDKQARPLPLCHLLYCLELHNDSTPGLWWGLPRGGCESRNESVWSAGRNVQEGEEAQSEVGNAFWETDGDLFEREPLELGSNFFSNLTLHWTIFYLKTKTKKDKSKQQQTTFKWAGLFILRFEATSR